MITALAAASGSSSTRQIGCRRRWFPGVLSVRDGSTVSERTGPGVADRHGVDATINVMAFNITSCLPAAPAHAVAEAYFCTTRVQETKLHTEPA